MSETKPRVYLLASGPFWAVCACDLPPEGSHTYHDTWREAIDYALSLSAVTR